VADCDRACASLIHFGAHRPRSRHTATPLALRLSPRRAYTDINTTRRNKPCGHPLPSALLSTLGLGTPTHIAPHTRRPVMPVPQRCRIPRSTSCLRQRRPLASRAPEQAAVVGGPSSLIFSTILAPSRRTDDGSVHGTAPIPHDPPGRNEAMSPSPLAAPNQLPCHTTPRHCGRVHSTTRPSQPVVMCASTGAP